MSRYILFTMILPKRQSSKPISLQFSESNEYMFGGIHDNTGSQVTIREWPSKSVQSGRGGQNRGSFQADASKVPGCRNAKRAKVKGTRSSEVPRRRELPIWQSRSAAVLWYLIVTRNFLLLCKSKIKQGSSKVPEI